MSERVRESHHCIAVELSIGVIDLAVDKLEVILTMEGQGEGLQQTPQFGTSGVLQNITCIILKSYM